MNAAQAQRFQQLLIEACDHYKEYEGGQIIARAFKTDSGQCPITCLLGSVSENVDRIKEINSLLNTTTFSLNDLWSFTIAFDGDHPNGLAKNVSASLVGAALRKKYL